jgi:peptide/nickel transport system substrate-binding protein
MFRKATCLLIGAVWVALVAVACTNDPYPGADARRKIYYTSFNEAPKSLDPAVAYDTAAHEITGNVYDNLLEYHYLKRPYTLIPGLAKALPQREVAADGTVSYTFELRPGLLYHDDICFALAGKGPGGKPLRTREVVAADVAFELMRVADAKVGSPVVRKFAAIKDFLEFRKRLRTLRAASPDFAGLPVRVQYKRAGGIAGVEVDGNYVLRLRLSRPDPQLKYWFAMPFTTPVPWEAVQYYDGENGRRHFRDHPVGTGPYRLAIYQKRLRMVLVKNTNWYGIRHPEWTAPGATYPTEGTKADRRRGRLDPAYTGKPLPFIERVEFRLEKESIPAFNKFLQGYFDRSGIISESFDNIVRNDALSPDMAARGIRLEKSVEASIFYIGFNMLDPTVGAKAGLRGRKLRQAMSLAIDANEFLRLFQNGRGVVAQSLIPPGLYGYDRKYRNPYSGFDLPRARKLLAEAGYPDGIDKKTGEPLKITFDTGSTSAQAMLRYQFFVNSWRRIGIDVEVNATTYNQFLEKLKLGAYQIYFTGWIADFPDPENFLFLLETSSGRMQSGGSNYSNFSNARYDALYYKMRALENGPKRLAMIREMISIIERERPWIELFHDETYVLSHPWVKNVKTFGLSYPVLKYIDLEPALRARLRKQWNRPVRWPLWIGLLLVAAFVVPGVFTFFRERQ